jgi:calcium/calmodulin-dependent protein kinase I
MLTKEEGGQITAKNFKICDFGLATYEDVDNYLYKRCGTPGYVSPEIVKADADDTSFRATTKCDTFSAGVILFLLLSK